jgi:serpin B
VAALLGNGVLRADELSANAAIRQALKKQMELNYHGEPLEQIAKELQTKLGAPVYLDIKALGDAGISTDTPVQFAIANVSAKAAIALMLRPLQLTTTVRHGTLVITTPEEADNAVDTRAYDVADLVIRDPRDEGSPDFDQLIEAIKTCVHPATWDDVGGPGSIAPFEASGIKALVFSQTNDVHEDVEDFLAALRAVRDRKTRDGKLSASSGPATPPVGAVIDPRLPRITEGEAAVRRALAKPISFQFHRTPLSKVLATMKEKTGLPILVDVEASSGRLPLDTKSLPTEMNNCDVSHDTPVAAEVKNVPLDMALDAMLKSLGLTWTYHHESLLITTPKQEGDLLVTRCYDVSDLPAFRDKQGKGVPDYQQIVDTIKATVGPAMWDDVGGAGTIAVFDQGGVRVISVSHDWKMHLRIEQLLLDLRKRRGPVPTGEQIAKLPLLPSPAEVRRNYRGGPRLNSGEPEGPPTPAPEPDVRREAIVNANNRFACDLYKQVTGKMGEAGRQNVVFSPTSIATVMAMVYAGACGQTAEEMAKTLHLTMPQADVAPAFQLLLATLPGANHRGCRLTLANAFWGQRDYQFTTDYLETLRKSFAAELTPVDFAQPDAVCQSINGWVSKKTEGKIAQIVGPENINNSLRFVATNAVHFEGRWSDRFSRYATTRAWFAGEKPVETPMMWQITSCRYGVADNLQILEKTYSGRDLAMMILLPGANPPAMSELERLLSVEKVKGWSAGLKEQAVEVHLPRFEFATSLDLNKSLAVLGMPKVFQPAEVDLSGIHSDKTPLWLSRVLHRAMIRVDEDGTVAAGVTVGMGTFGGPPPMPVFRADHPFVFLIRDTRTDNILFLGRLVQPNPAPQEMPQEARPGRTGGGMGMF